MDRTTCIPCGSIIACIILCSLIPIIIIIVVLSTTGGWDGSSNEFLDKSSEEFFGFKNAV